MNKFTEIVEADFDQCDSCGEATDKSDLKRVNTDDYANGGRVCSDCLNEYYTYDETTDTYLVKEQ